MFVLPVSGTPVVFQAPNGNDDIFFTESPGEFPADARFRVDVVRRLTRPAAAAMEWDALPYVDVDAALLGLHQFLKGDRIVAEIQCTKCGAWGDVELSITAYLTANRPRAPRKVGERFASQVMRRIPTVAQVLTAIEKHGHGERAALLIESEAVAGCDQKEARQLRTAIEKAGPHLAGPVEGDCPECSERVAGWFDAGAFVIAELRLGAAAIFEEVHLLAARYGWTEDMVLALPRLRRAAYADLIHAERLAAQ